MLDGDEAVLPSAGRTGCQSGPLAVGVTSPLVTGAQNTGVLAGAVGMGCQRGAMGEANSVLGAKPVIRAQARAVCTNPLAIITGAKEQPTSKGLGMELQLLAQAFELGAACGSELGNQQAVGAGARSNRINARQHSCLWHELLKMLLEGQQQGCLGLKPEGDQPHCARISKGPPGHQLQGCIGWTLEFCQQGARKLLLQFLNSKYQANAAISN